MVNLPVPYPAPSAVTGVVETSAFWNANVRDAVGFLTNPPILQVFAGAGQAIAAGAWTQVNLNTVVADSYAAFNTTTHQYTAPVAGWYEVFGNIPYAHLSTTPGFFAALYKNAVAVTNASGGSTAHTSVDGVSASIGWQIFLNVGDFIDMRTWTNLANSTFSNGMQAPNMNLRWIHF